LEPGVLLALQTIMVTLETEEQHLSVVCVLLREEKEQVPVLGMLETVVPVVPDLIVSLTVVEVLMVQMELMVIRLVGKASIPQPVLLPRQTKLHTQAVAVEELIQVSTQTVALEELVVAVMEVLMVEENQARQIQVVAVVELTFMALEVGVLRVLLL
jgi:hypothetical protein